MSRASGSKFEFTVIRCLKSLGLSPADERTIKKEAKYILDDEEDETCKQALSTIVNGYTTYELLNDRNNHKTTADMILEGPNLKPLFISCKYNNVSLKHQRPSALASQMAQSTHISDSYVKQYKKINDKFVKMCKRNDYVTFSEVPKQKIAKLYEDINELVVKHINESHDLSRKILISFILDLPRPRVPTDDSDYEDDEYETPKHEHYILLRKHGKVKLMNRLDINVGTVTATYEKSYLYITVEHTTGSLALKLRIHSASKAITANLSLKYDSKLAKGNIKKLFRTTVFRD